MTALSPVAGPGDGEDEPHPPDSHDAVGTEVAGGSEGEGAQDDEDDEDESPLDKVLDGVLQGVPLDPEGRRTIEGRLEMVIAQTRSPIPPPFILRGYEEIVPGSAARLFAGSEAQARHRQALEAKVIGGDNRRADIGQVMAFVVALSFLWVAWDLISGGEAVAGTILGTVDIVGLVSVFILGQNRQASGAARQRAETDEK